MVDDEDYAFLDQFNWTRHTKGYGVRELTSEWAAIGTVLLLHFAIMGRREGYVVDHIDRNPLNNQKSNLRFISQSANCVNSKRKNASGYRGVVWCKDRGRWRAQIKHGGYNHFLGYFDQLEDAARASEKARSDYIERHVLRE
jgi:hypothetical protein